jgi:murein DD-endopeptidase MepM/ murein hydrolase activator NlpD
MTRTKKKTTTSRPASSLVFDLPPAGFTQTLVCANGLDARGFQAWLFDPAMLFAASRMWWDDRGARPKPHEGLDLCFYWGHGLQAGRLGVETEVPATYDGTVVRLCDDLIGRSVMMAHRFPGRPGHVYTLYGHTRPRADLEPGCAVRAGEVVAQLAPVTRPGATVLPHLHISVGWSPEPVQPDRLDWDTVPELLHLLDPLPLLDTTGHRA